MCCPCCRVTRQSRSNEPPCPSPNSSFLSVSRLAAPTWFRSSVASIVVLFPNETKFRLGRFHYLLRNALQTGSFRKTSWLPLRPISWKRFWGSVSREIRSHDIVPIYPVSVTNRKNHSSSSELNHSLKVKRIFRPKTTGETNSVADHAPRYFFKTSRIQYTPKFVSRKGRSLAKKLIVFVVSRVVVSSLNFQAFISQVYFTSRFYYLCGY